MSTLDDTLSSQTLKVSHVAHSLNSANRQKIGIQAIGGNTPISHLAVHYKVSRKFIYQQKEKALEGIVQAFKEQSTEDDDKVLFYLPVSKRWISQFIIVLLLIARCSYQGVVEIFRDLFDYNISKGSVHNTIYRALDQAKTINRKQDLSGITVGLHDEIYQAGDPVLAGVCAHTTYCYLLSLEESCDANAWGVHLLELKEKQNLKPSKTIADGGPSARKGQKDAWPETPCGGDTFHALGLVQMKVTLLTSKVVFDQNRARARARARARFSIWCFWPFLLTWQLSVLIIPVLLNILFRQ